MKRIDACKFLQQASETFDIVFLDPPFAKNLIPLCLETLAHSRVLIPGGLLYLESPEEIVVDQSLWQQVKLKKTGQIVYGLYKKR